MSVYVTDKCNKERKEVMKYDANKMNLLYFSCFTVIIRIHKCIKVILAQNKKIVVSVIIALEL